MAFKDFSEFKAALGGDKSAAPEARPLVLVVDDEEVIRRSLELALRRSYRVMTCADAKRGIEAVSDDVGVVILDIKMSGMDGFGAAAEIRKKDPDMPIIFHSAYQDRKDPYEVMNEYRPFGYITKGESPDVLLRSVAAAVEHRERTTRHRGLLAQLGEVQSQMDTIRKRLGAR